MSEAGHPETPNVTASGRDALILRLLEEHDMGCPVCSQLLRGMTTARCTECGAAIKLQLTAPEARMGAWLTAVIALAVPFGFATMFGVLLLVFGFVAGTHEPRTLAACLGATVLSGPGLGLLLRGRRRFFGLAPTVQHAWAAGTVAISLVMVVVLLLSGMRA